MYQKVFLTFEYLSGASRGLRQEHKPPAMQLRSGP